jgi:hypothetical protein
MSSDVSPGIETRKCDICGAEFSGITADSVDEKIQNHRRDCEADDGSNSGELELSDWGRGEDARVSVTIKPPRQIEAYGTTAHFRRMVQKRQEPDASKAQAQTVLKMGQIKASHISDHYLFDYEDGRGWQWRVVVGILDEAFRVPQSKHKLITIFALNSDQHGAVDKWT